MAAKCCLTSSGLEPRASRMLTTIASRPICLPQRHMFHSISGECINTKMWWRKYHAAVTPYPTMTKDPVDGEQSVFPDMNTLNTYIQCRSRSSHVKSPYQNGWYTLTYQVFYI